MLQLTFHGVRPTFCMVQPTFRSVWTTFCMVRLTSACPRLIFPSVFWLFQEEKYTFFTKKSDTKVIKITFLNKIFNPSPSNIYVTIRNRSVTKIIQPITVSCKEWPLNFGGLKKSQHDINTGTGRKNMEQIPFIISYWLISSFKKSLTIHIHDQLLTKTLRGVSDNFVLKTKICSAVYSTCCIESETLEGMKTTLTNSAWIFFLLLTLF